MGGPTYRFMAPNFDDDGDVTEHYIKKNRILFSTIESPLINTLDS